MIARLNSAEALAYLEARSSAQTVPSVRKVLDELVQPTPSAAPKPGITADENDVFARVALGQETREAICAWARRLSAADLDEAIRWLVDPAPWPGDPRMILATVGLRDHEGLARLLQRPDLTPLHLVQLLRLSGLLHKSAHEMLMGNLDLSIPRELSERLFAAYRDSHQPRLGLRELAAAFDASALEPDLIARARFQTDWHRRFEWEDEAIWPYFADRLNWLAQELNPPPKAAFEWGTGWLSPADRRRHALAVIAAFPEPPVRFLPRLWEIARGTSKTDRPLAQKSLEKLADCLKRVFEALASGKAQNRTAAAEWISRRKHEGVAEALRAAVDSEKSAPVKAALTSALEVLGGAATTVERGGEDARDALKAESVKELKKGIPEKLGWFPFDRLPDVRWLGDDQPIERSVVNWLAISAWKTKSAEPTAIVRDQVALLRPDDAQVLGKAVLDAWLAADLRPQTPEEVQKRLVSPLTTLAMNSGRAWRTIVASSGSSMSIRWDGRSGGCIRARRPARGS